MTLVTGQNPRVCVESIRLSGVSPMVLNVCITTQWLLSITQWLLEQTTGAPTVILIRNKQFDNRKQFGPVKDMKKTMMVGM